MVDKDQLIKELGLENLGYAEQQAIYEDFTYELGAAISDGLEDAQMDEFTAIINGDEDTISAWLASHTPNYREDPTYQELEIGYQDDPEKVPANKVYASIAWVRVNRPDFESIMTRVKREFRAALDAQAAEQPS